MADAVVPISTPVGTFDAPMRVEGKGQVLLAFRGGRWRDWWTEELLLTAAAIRTYSQTMVYEVLALWELDGELRTRYLVVPDEIEARLREVMRQWDQQAPPRIKKNDSRGRAVCPRCPVRSRCESVDLQRGETQDWF